MSQVIEGYIKMLEKHSKGNPSWKYENDIAIEHLKIILDKISKQRRKQYTAHCANCGFEFEFKEDKK